MSTTTCWRYVNEAVELLAARVPKLRAALRKAKRENMAYVIIDGTLIPIDRSLRPPFSSLRPTPDNPGRRSHGYPQPGHLSTGDTPSGRTCRG